MKKYLKLLIALVVILQLGCSKDSKNNEDTPSSKEKMAYYFEDESELADWNISSNGTGEINNTEKYNGNSSFKLAGVTACHHVDKIEGVSVEKDKTYKLKFYAKVIYSQIEDPALCAGDIILWVKQGNEYVLNEYIGGAENWTEKNFYFTSESNTPVTIEFLIGTIHGVWIDDLIITEQ